MFGQAFVVCFDTMCRSKILVAEQHSFFACVAYGKKRLKQGSVRASKKLFNQAYPGQKFSTFPGVPCQRMEIKRLAKIFKISIRIYIPNDAMGLKKRLVLSCTIPNATHSFDLLYFNNIFSFITNIEKFIGFHVCTLCNKALKTFSTLYKHKRRLHSTSLPNIKTKSIKGAYRTSCSTRDILFQAGIPQKYLKNTSYPYFAVFDIESSLQNAESVAQSFGGAPLVTSEHVPMAIGVSSNFQQKTKIFVAKKTELV